MKEMVRTLIINADDFGKDERINKAIVSAFRQGLCSSATLMPNLPGFEEACELARSNRLLNHVGLHLVLRDAAPLTERIKRFPKFCDQEGRLNLARPASFLPILHFWKLEREALVEEIRAQIQRCRKEGILLTHVDSHYHLHNEWAVACVLIPLLREQRIPYLRIARNCGGKLGPFRRIYKGLLNRKIQWAQLDRSRYFGSVEDYTSLKKNLGDRQKMGSFEVMIHPVLKSGATALLDDATQQPLEEIVQAVDAYSEAVSFSGCRYGG